ncbi:MAG TPA: hypothetical protein VGQ13_02540 [Nitrososphaera sp.]|nr:hypothetical protein [Nitrososphaera sp.]
MSEEATSYILRVQKDELEKRLFSLRTFYVGIRRDWSHGTLVLFVRKDAFIGSGVIERIVALDGLEDWERKLCLENNWYCKIVFSKLTRFQPVVPVHDTSAARQNPSVLHGASISRSDALQIEKLSPARIIL